MIALAITLATESMHDSVTLLAIPWITGGLPGPWGVVSAWVPTVTFPSTSARTRQNQGQDLAFSSVTTTTCWLAKRNKKQAANQDADDLDRWYGSVNADASPDDVFWEEMQRQRLLAQVGDAVNANLPDPVAAIGATNTNTNSLNNPDSLNTSPYPTTTTTSSSSFVPSPLSSSPRSGSNINLAINTPAARSVEATLSEYEAFSLTDNWLDDELAWMMQKDFVLHEGDPNAHVKSLDEQIEEWELSEDGNMTDEDDLTDSDNAWMQSDDPWDHWGVSEEEQQRALRVSNKADEFLFDSDADDREDSAQQEADFWSRVQGTGIKSRRLERARGNAKAQAFFSRGPDDTEGYDRLWVSAIDNVCFKNLVGTFRNYGVQFADNFGDWKDASVQDGLLTIEDVASFKARRVHNVTGLPCIASRTSFEIEPVPELNTGSGSGSPRPSSRSTVINTNPRVTSGYRFNDIGMHVDYVCDALRPLSEPTRVTRFKTCLCYYDGEVEVFDYGVCDCDLLFADSMRTFIPMSQAINEMVKTLELTFGLEYQRWLQSRLSQAMSGIDGASMKLRDRVLKEGKVLPNDIIDVSAFMDSKIDVNLMDECAEELASRFVSQKPSKILTVATTGLVIALPMAKYLQVPVVYARKERNVVMADTYKASYSSKTVGQFRELLVSKSHLDEDDRILIIDDFLSSGASQEALLQLVFDAGATAVGVGVLLEKVYDSGRQSLSGFDIPIHSMCRVASVESGVIQMVEEEGFDLMQKSSQQEAL
jgi:xanthine phosphoribosyltransferase